MAYIIFPVQDAPSIAENQKMWLSGKLIRHGFYGFLQKNIMKTNVTKLHTFLLAAVIAVCSCNNAGNNTAQNMADSAAAKVDTAVQAVKQGAQNLADEADNIMNGNVDSNFVVKAAATNNAEMKILQAGIDMGTDKEIKVHARMMLADHKKLGEKVKAYASKKGYILPEGDNGKSDKEMTKLNNNSNGAEWDKEWVNHMVSAHQDAIDMFEKAENNVKDPDLKNIIADALPTLNSHLEMMKKLQDRIGK